MNKPLPFQHLTILGLSKSGCAVARYFQPKNVSCFISDATPETDINRPLKEEMEALGVQVELGGHTDACFKHSNWVMTSPGIPPRSVVLSTMRMMKKTIVSEVELAYHISQERNIPLIGITGTNGKTTTTSLISYLLEQNGLVAPACGNIGQPIIEILNTFPKIDCLVEELSSYQLTYSPTLTADIAILTNFTPDHLEWHGSLEGYREAKMKLFTGNQAPKWAILPAGDETAHRIEKASSPETRILWFSRDSSPVKNLRNHASLTPEGRLYVQLDGSRQLFGMANQLRILGDHNIDNALMALSAICIGKHVLPSFKTLQEDTLTKALQAFPGVSHRLEWVKTLTTEEGKTLSFYNDSKATNPESCIAALKAFRNQPVILLAGGRDKNGPLEEWASSVKQHAKAVVLYGEAQDRFAEALEEAGYSAYKKTPSTEDTLKTAFNQALQLVTQDEPILLSPACASFDMFSNFEARGDHFKQLVQEFSASLNTLTSGISG